MKKILTAICLLLAISSFAQKEIFDEQMYYADSLIDSKNYDDAITVFEKLLIEKPKDTRLLNNLGRAYYINKNYIKAKEKFRLAAFYTSADDKESLSLYYSNLSACYANLNDDEKAYQYSIKAYLINEDSELNLWNAASIGQNFGKYNEVLNLLDNSKIEKKNYFNSIYGRCYYKLGEYKRSVESYMKFFDDYNENDDFITLDLNDEKSIYLGVSIDLLKDSIRNNENLNYRDAGLKFINEMSKSEKRNVIFEKLFYNDDSYWATSEISKQTLKEIFKNIDKPTLSENIYLYYYIADYQKTLSLTNEFLQKNLSSEETDHGKEYQYLASLNLLMQDFKESGNLKETDYNVVERYYKNLFDENINYNDPYEDIELKYPIKKTFSVAKRYFTTPDEQKIGMSVLLRILINTPNEKFRKMLNKTMTANNN